MFDRRNRPRFTDEPATPEPPAENEGDDPFDSLDQLFTDALSDLSEEEAPPPEQPGVTFASDAFPAPEDDLGAAPEPPGPPTREPWQQPAEPEPAPSFLADVPEPSASFPTPEPPPPASSFAEAPQPPPSPAPQEPAPAPPPAAPEPPEDAMVRSFTGRPVEHDFRHEEVMDRLRGLERQVRSQAERTQAAVRELSERIGAELSSLDRRAINLELAVTRLRNILELVDANLRQLGDEGTMAPLPPPPAGEQPGPAPPQQPPQRDVQGMIDRIWNDPPS